MVNINLTVLIELVLYLIFLWGTGRFILGPILRTIDEREEDIEQTQVKTQADRTEAERLESEYARAISETRTEAEETFRRTRQQALQEHQSFIAEQRQQADESVAAVRLEAERASESARPEVLESAPELAKSITEKLTGGRAT